MRVIEALFGLSPDNSSGATELALFLTLAAAAAVFLCLRGIRSFQRAGNHRRLG
jgi:hypothetical protein